MSSFSQLPTTPYLTLGAACPFTVLGETALTSVGTSWIQGDMGISPGTTSNIIGFSLVSSLAYGGAYSKSFPFSLSLSLFVVIFR